MTQVKDKVQINSSVIEAIKYAGTTLFVYFKQGQVYAYSCVPQAIFDAFKEAHSKGRYFRDNIVGRYLYTRAV